jgi:adenylylsulfate kinase
LEKRGIKSRIVSIDQIREKYNIQKYDFESRKKAYNRLVEVGLESLKNGNNMIFDATGNYRVFRDSARKKIPNFAEIYLKCPIQICMDREFERDEKKAYLIYKQRDFVPGVHIEYEEPENPEVMIETDKKSPEESVNIILTRLKDFFR